MHKIRAQITKEEPLRYISHLDYAGAVERSVRRAALPVAYSEGFNPHMRLSFASALALGVTSEAEFLELDFLEPVAQESFLSGLGAVLPAGMRLIRAKCMEQKQPALMALIDLAVYEIRLPFSMVNEKAAHHAVERYHALESVRFVRISPKKGKKEIELKEYCQSVEIQKNAQAVVLTMPIRVTPSGSVKPVEVLTVLEEFGMQGKPYALLHRKALYARGKNPLDVEV